jgi:hypothetical protein
LVSSIFSRLQPVKAHPVISIKINKRIRMKFFCKTNGSQRGRDMGWQED